MKFLLSVALAAVCISNVKIDKTLAQANAPTPAAPSTEIPLPLIQAAPLIQAVSKLLGQQSYQIESTLELTSVATGSPLAAQAQIKTIIAAPNKVNTKITFFDEVEASGKQYQIIANGTQVWIYDLEANQYSVSEYRQFLATTTSLSVGTLANFYLRTLNTINNNKIASRAIAKLPPDRLIRYFQRFANLDLQNMVIRNEQIAGKAYAIYDIDATDRSYEVTAYVSPQQANVERVDLIGKQNNVEILLLEQVVSQTIPETIAEDTFSFVPPEDAEQVDEPIKLNPFF